MNLYVKNYDNYAFESLLGACLPFTHIICASDLYLYLCLYCVCICICIYYMYSNLCVKNDDNYAFESLLGACLPFTHIICAPIFVVNLPCSESDICRNDQDFGDNHRPKILKLLLKYLKFYPFTFWSFLAKAWFSIHNFQFIVVLVH